MGFNPSTIWAQLAAYFGAPASGSIPFVDTDGASIAVDPNNFSYAGPNANINGTQLLGQLTVANSVRVQFVDQSGVPAQDSYTINAIAGKLRVGVGKTAVQVFCNKCFQSSIILSSQETSFVGANSYSLTPGNGGFQVSTNVAVATTDVILSFLIVNTFSP